MKKILGNVVFGVYIVIAVIITICLLSYNNFKTTIFGENALINVSDDLFGDKYKKGDLVIVDCKDEIKVGDKVFYYTTFEQNVRIAIDEVKNIEDVNNTEKTYTIGEDHKVSSEYVLGTAETTKTIKTLGTILSVMESKWGYLFLIVLPALLAFVYQITVVVSEIINEKKSEKNEKK